MVYHYDEKFIIQLHGIDELKILVVDYEFMHVSNDEYQNYHPTYRCVEYLKIMLAVRGHVVLPGANLTLTWIQSAVAASNYNTVLYVVLVIGCKSVIYARASVTVENVVLYSKRDPQSTTTSLSSDNLDP
mgnify:CR=1 FL=1